MTVIAAMGLDGVRAPPALPGAVNAVTFESYVKQFLVPELHRGDVVILDNLSSHLGPAVFEAIERIGARTMEHLYDVIGEGLRAVAAQDILGWFGHAGWRATRT